MERFTGCGNGNSSTLLAEWVTTNAEKLECAPEWEPKWDPEIPTAPVQFYTQETRIDDKYLIWMCQ